MTKVKVMKSPIADIQRTVDLMVAKANKPASAPAAATSSKVAKIKQIQKGLDMPDIETYMRAFTDLPDSLIDELLAIVEKSPSAMAVKTFAKKWGLV